MELLGKLSVLIVEDVELCLSGCDVLLSSVGVLFDCCEDVLDVDGGGVVVDEGKLLLWGLRYEEWLG